MARRRLTPFARLLITLAILAAIFFGVRYLLDQENGGQGATISDTISKVADDVLPAQKTETNRFNYTPPAPQNGKLLGVVELGASGFNSFIIRADEEGQWKLEKSEYGSSLVHENMTTEQDVREGLKRYIGQMIDYGVGSRNIHFVVSSGAARSEVAEKISIALKTIGYFVNTVTPEEEGSYALKAVLPEAYQDKAFVVDMGSGNTKVSWMRNEKLQALETYGSKYYQGEVTDESVYEAVKEVAKKIPADRTDVCFIIGGVPFELAKDIRDGKERYTVLNLPEQYEAESEKQRAGLNIYRAIQQTTGTETYVFDWDANFTIGFLLSL